MTDDDLETSQAVLMAAAIGFVVWYFFLWVLAELLESFL